MSTQAVSNIKQPEATISIYGKLSEARRKFHSLKLNKSGQNKFAGYRYFELADFLVPGMDCLREQGLVPIVTFEAERAVMRIYDADTSGHIEITSPMASANLKGCHDIQNLGAVETYQRRYLWMAALEIVEHDALDSAPPAEEVEYIDAGQLADIEALIEEVGADRDKFMQWLSRSLKVNSLERISKKAYGDVVSALEKKRRT